jgi:hypothetical protein
MYARVHPDNESPFEVRVFVNGDEGRPTEEELVELLAAPDPQTWVERHVETWVQAFPFAAIEVYVEDTRTGAEYYHGRA